LADLLSILIFEQGCHSLIVNVEEGWRLGIFLILILPILCKLPKHISATFEPIHLRILELFLIIDTNFEFIIPVLLDSLR